jgi:hypothetical protein
MSDWNPLPPPAPRPLTPFPEEEVKVEAPPVEPAQPVVAKPKTARINPDNPKVLALALFLVFVLMASSFVVSFFGIWGISRETTNLPEVISWLPALFLDAAILAYTISYFVFKYRGEATGKTLTALWVFAVLSVAANVVHTMEGFAPDTSVWAMAVGIAITGSAPIAVVVASEEIARLAFENPRKEKESKTV